ncbi:MAG: phosphotransferase family protein [Bacillota bacterium]
MSKGELLAQGRTGEVYAWGESEILKLYLPGFPVYDVDHEYAISRLVHDHGIPTPYAMSRVEIDDRHGIVFERLTGRTMLHLMAADPMAVPAMARNLAELHYQIHQIRAAGFPSRKRGLRRQIQSTAQLTGDEKSSILSALDALPDDSHLCHGDFHPDNVLIADGRPSIIDWMTGSAGSPASDVVRSCIIFMTATPPPGAPVAVEDLRTLLKRTLYREYLTRYLSLSGMGITELEQWLLPVAAARLAEGLPEVEKEQLLNTIRSKMAGEDVLAI